jgi:Tfp pilus assembly protein PilN
VNQQINLYQPIFRRQKKVFSAVAMLQVALIFFVVFASIYLYGQSKLQPLREQSAQVRAELAKVNAQLSKMENSADKESPSKLMENEIARLTAELEKRRQIMDVLQNQTLGNTAGLSAYMTAFARQHVQGMWLTKVSVSNGGRNLGLQGKTLNSELVPQYLARLGGEDVLNGMSFNALQLSQPEDKTIPLEFTVSTN